MQFFFFTYLESGLMCIVSGVLTQYFLIFLYIFDLIFKNYQASHIVILGTQTCVISNAYACPCKNGENLSRSNVGGTIFQSELWPKSERDMWPTEGATMRQRGPGGSANSTTGLCLGEEMTVVLNVLHFRLMSILHATAEDKPTRHSGTEECQVTGSGTSKIFTHGRLIIEYICRVRPFPFPLYDRAICKMAVGSILN